MKLALLLCSVIPLLSVPLRAQFTDDDWHDIGGVQAPGWESIRAMTTNSQGRLYVGGNFSSVGGVPANNVVMWDGTSWQAMGPGLGTYRVTSLASDGENVYAAYVGAVAKWDGASWTVLGLSGNTGPSAGSMNGVWMDGAAVYAVGDFHVDGDVARPRLGRWMSGTGWTVLGTFTGGILSSVCKIGQDIYVGGSFSEVDGVAANNIAKWNGLVWSPLGVGVDNMVNALVVHEGALIAGGAFGHAGGLGANRLAKWNGSTWSKLGNGLYHPASGGVVEALAVGNGILFAGGRSIAQSGDLVVRGVAWWDGGSWRPLGVGVEPAVHALAAQGSSLFVGGEFDEVADKPLQGLARADLSMLHGGSAFLDTAIQSGLSGDDAESSATPHHDGVANLLKYASNLDLSGPDCRTMAPGGTAGLPYFSRVNGMPAMFRIEYLRRVGAGLNYVAETSATLDAGAWTPVPGTPQVTAVDDSWERIVYEMPATGARLFGRVRVELQP